jgi:RNA-directed DNA polymerase
VKDASWETRPVEVAVERSKQAGEIRARWAWVEPVVWTDRMLAALEKGVQGGVWFSLIDKVTSLRGLRAAWGQVQRNRGSGGVDRETIDQFGRETESRLSRLSEQLKDGSYQPLPVRRVYIPKPDGRKRPLGIPAVRDRIVQAAVRNVLEPVFEREFCEHSYGFRPGRGAKDALRRVDGQLKAGYRYVLDADLKSYFDTIPHDRLLSLVRQRVADGRVLALIEAFLNQSILEEMNEWKPTEGTPQGGVISPLLANIYLHPLDELMRDRGFEMTRYADDFVVLCRTAEECSRALEMIRAWVTETGLTLHPEKTRVVDMNEPGGFDFLGYHFERHYRKPRLKSMEKLKETIRTKTRRTNGQSLPAIITDLNRTLRGWFGYFKHSCHWVFSDLDKWIRMRLRSILRKRQGKRGRGRGSDHQRWPNAYFAEMGLFSMMAVYREASRPHRVH